MELQKLIDKINNEKQKILNDNLSEVSKKGKLDLVKYLVEQGANASYGISEASSYGHLDVVKYLHQNGADINQTDTIDNSVLYYASREGHLEMVKYCVENGANVNYMDDCNETAIKRAAEAGHLEIIKFLHQNGGDLDSAIKVARSEIKEELINYKTNMEEKTLIQNDLKEVKQEQQKPKNTMRI